MYIDSIDTAIFFLYILLESCWPRCESLVKEVQCPSGFECTDAFQCKWSHEILEILSTLPLDNLLWNFHSTRFVKQICNKKLKQVCCCGHMMVSPDRFEDSNNSLGPDKGY